MLLDANQDPSDGLEITPRQLESASAWGPVDFADTGRFDAAMDALISAGKSTELGDGRSLKTSVEAQDHLESTLRCAYAGGYRGTFSGEDRGSFGILVDATTGNVRGIAYSDIEEDFLELAGQTPITFDHDASFVSGTVSTGANFAGQFNSVNRLSGTWTDPTGGGGSFSGSRIGGDADARYRFTGTFEGGSRGLLTLDVSDSGEVTGVIYSVDDDAQESISGSVSGTTLNATVSGASVTGTLNRETGELSGQWSDS